jgi:hypothetical protein
MKLMRLSALLATAIVAVVGTGAPHAQARTGCERVNAVHSTETAYQVNAYNMDCDKARTRLRKWMKRDSWGGPWWDCDMSEPQKVCSLGVPEPRPYITFRLRP